MNCLLCQSKCHPFSQNPFGNFWTCPHCRAICRDPEAFLSSQAEKDRYQHHQNALDDPNYQAYFKHIIDQAIQPFCNLGPDCLALDYGSGPQPVLAHVLEQDYGQPMENYDPYFAPNRAVIDQQTYHLITCIEVAEHFYQPNQEFTRLANLLKKHGKLIISTRFAPINKSQFDHWWYMHDPTHVCFYCQETFQYIAQSYGFQILASDQQSWITLEKI